MTPNNLDPANDAVALERPFRQARQRVGGYLVLALILQIVFNIAIFPPHCLSVIGTFSDFLHRIFEHLPVSGWLSKIACSQDATEVPRSIIAALVDSLAVIFFLEVFFKFDEARRLVTTLETSLQFIFGGGSPELFSKLSPTEQNLMISNSLINTLGPEYGEVVHKDIVSAYLGREISYREGFTYRVTCYDDFPQLTSPTDFTPTKEKFLNLIGENYAWVRQDLAYTRHGKRSTGALPILLAKFTFDQLQLNQFISEDALFFRELLRFEDDAKSMLKSCTQDELDSLVREVFEFRAWSIDSKRALDFKVRWADIEKSPRYIQVEIENPSGAVEGSGCRLEFVLPHLRSDPQFLVTLPQPIKPEALISFEKSSKMTNLSFIPFISKFKDDALKVEMWPVRDPKTIQIRISAWAFPTGGFVFTWDP